MWWELLGFKKTANLPVPNLKASDVAFVPVSVNTAMALTQFNWKDRLRLLVSGRLHIRVLTYTPVKVDRTHTLINVAVLAPDQEGI